MEYFILRNLIVKVFFPHYLLCPTPIADMVKLNWICLFVVFSGVFLFLTCVLHPYYLPTAKSSRESLCHQPGLLWELWHDSKTWGSVRMRWWCRRRSTDPKKKSVMNGQKKRERDWEKKVFWWWITNRAGLTSVTFVKLNTLSRLQRVKNLWCSFVTTN